MVQAVPASQTVPVTFGWVKGRPLGGACDTESAIQRESIIQQKKVDEGSVNRKRGHKLVT